ncbi:MAG: CcmD family protein [Ignavibacteria bacterium]
MYEFLEKNSLYLVLIIALIIWTGIFIYLYKLGKKITNLEIKLKENNWKQ